MRNISQEHLLPLAENIVLTNAQERRPNFIRDCVRGDPEFNGGGIVLWQRAINLFPCGMVLIGKKFEDSHESLWDSHERYHKLSHSSCTPTPFSRTVTGELFEFRTEIINKPFVKMDRELNPRQRRILRVHGLTPLKPDFTKY